MTTRVRVGAEDLLLQVGLEAAHHREHDDERHHAHAHPAHRQRGHHRGGGLLVELELVQRLGGGQRVLQAQRPDAGALDRGLGRGDDRRR